MSANNWTTCPRCAIRQKARAATLREEVDAAYGTVPVEVWKLKDKAATEANGEVQDTTFREDYEIYGADEGVITVSYSGYCCLCCLSVSFKDTHEIPDLSK